MFDLWIFYAPKELKGYTKITNQEAPLFKTSLILTGKNKWDEYLKQVFFHFSLQVVAKQDLNH